MNKLHDQLGARWTEVNAVRVVDYYADSMAEHRALSKTVGVLDLSFRSRICITGADRKRFLHGQVTNDVNSLKRGQGCYAAIVTAKGKLQSDANIYDLGNEMLLDFEPGQTSAITQRLEKYIIADDVQIVDVGPHYGLISIQGPKGEEALKALGVVREVPREAMSFTVGGPLTPALSPRGGEGESMAAQDNFAKPNQRDALVEEGDAFASDSGWTEVYCVNNRRGAAPGFDMFVPVGALPLIFRQVVEVAKELGGLPCGWQALEMVRIEAGIPRFMQDMGLDNLAPEAGIEGRAISYMKGCYIGQEVISRIRTYGQVAKALRGLVLAQKGLPFPKPGERIFFEGKDVGFITSALASPTFGKNIAMGYVRREHNQIGTELQIGPSAWPARIVPLPFDPANL